MNTEDGIVSERVAALWDVRTDVLIKALEARGYKVLAARIYDELVRDQAEIAAMQTRMEELDADG